MNVLPVIYTDFQTIKIYPFYIGTYQKLYTIAIPVCFFLTVTCV